MFTRLLYVCLLAFSAINCVFTNAQNIKLSKHSNISLLTCSSGDELYSVFGHSALRVSDDSLGIDIVFNYGTFDFNTPNFYLKFMNGDLEYMLASNTYNSFIRSYIRDNRSVKESVVDLTQTQKEQLWDYLLWNIRPENRFYRYDFFFDNCATRIRDIIFQAKQINPKDSSISVINGLTFRDYIHYYVDEKSWTAQGIDLLLGIKTDKQASYFDRAYLPVYLDSLFVNTNIVCKQTDMFTKEYISENQSEFTMTPDIFGWSLLVVSLLVFVYENKAKRYVVYYDILFFLACGLLSILFWYLWLFTKHSVCSWNINVMWASVLYLPMIVYLLKNKISTNFIKYSIFVNLAFLAMYILLSAIGVQDVASMTIPIALSLAIRNISLLNRSKAI